MAALGWDDAWQAALDAVHPGATPGRVAVEYQDRVTLWTAAGDIEAFLSGKLRAHADRLMRPAVGDWVAVATFETGPATVLATLPRRTLVVRRAAGERVLPQVVAANVDTVLIVTSANADLNPRRIERYLAAVVAGGATPVVVLNKVDAVDATAPFLEALAPVTAGVRVLEVSATRGDGLDAVHAFAEAGHTVALVGSSGVGKSSLINALTRGRSGLATAAVRASDDKGRHTTRNRVLVSLPAGGTLVDTPGMRELQLWEDATGDVFGDITTFAERCRFSDCQHDSEPDCAVRDAVARGALDPRRVQGYHKLRTGASSRPGRRRAP